jgi:hypothetical protein
MQTASEFERREKKRIVTAFIVSFALAVLALFFASVAKGAPGADPESRIPSPGLSAPSPESRIPSPGFFVPSSESRLFRPESRLPSFRFLMRNGRLVAFASPQPPAPIIRLPRVRRRFTRAFGIPRMERCASMPRWRQIRMLAAIPPPSLSF